MGMLHEWQFRIGHLFVVTIGQLLDFTSECFVQNDLYIFISLYRKMITGLHHCKKTGHYFLANPQWVRLGATFP
jgi:hypothetical protein